MFDGDFTTYHQIDSVINLSAIHDAVTSFSFVIQKTYNEKQIVVKTDSSEYGLELNYDTLAIEDFSKQLQNAFGVKRNNPVLKQIETIKLNNVEVYDI